LPTNADTLPSGPLWLHEIKHDGFRVVALEDGDRARLYSRPGNDLTFRFPLIVEALSSLRSRSCIIDGEAVCCDDKGVPNFSRAAGMTKLADEIALCRLCIGKVAPSIF
jgi:ATP-dependent DNA ligase